MHPRKLYCYIANMNELKGMLEFVAVVQCGTFTGAARQLDLSVSHISRQIAALEARLGTQLFQRTTRKMQLTDTGRSLFDSSQPLLEELLRAQAELQANKQVMEGKIRISLAGKFSEEELVPCLAAFCAEHAGIEIDLDVSGRNVDLVGDGFHLAVRMGPLESSNSITATRLLSVPMVVLASKGLLARLPRIRTPADLSSRHCLPLAGRAWNFVKGQAHHSLKPTGRFACNSGAAAIEAAIADIGLVCVPAYYAREPVSQGRLERLFPTWRLVDESVFYLAFPTNRFMPPRVRKLIAHLQEHVASMTLDGNTSESRG